LIEMIAQAKEDAHLDLAGLGVEASAPVVDGAKGLSSLAVFVNVASLNEAAELQRRESVMSSQLERIKKRQ